jgi:L,D-peptidoglycan transpeptidase YkuD (ErfK/YbiS/YcfS/YnhG family)
MDIEYRQINGNCYWVDDPYSEYYNQWRDITNDPEGITWNSAEHLLTYATSYHYAVVVNYNMDPIVPGKGSAIFLHTKTGSSTAGCISVPDSTMYDILYWLRAGTGEEDAPRILIV